MFRTARARMVPILGLMLAAIVLAGCSQAVSPTTSPTTSPTNSPPNSPTMTVALTPVTTTACVKMTQERGTFKKAGLDVNLVAAPATSAAQIAQVINGQVSVGIGAYTGVISAVASGLKVVITNASDYDFDNGGVAQTAFAVLVPQGSSIKSFKDLVGKTVAVNSLRGTWELATRQAIAEKGGDPSKVQLTTVSFADQGAALKANRVDAIVTLQPLVASLTAQGFRSIGDPFAAAMGKPDPVSAVMFMSKQFVSDNPQAAKAFVASMVEGNAWCNKHPDDMLNQIASITKIPKASLAHAPLPVFGAGIDSAETKTWINLLVKYGVVKEAPSVANVQWSGAPTR